MKEKDTSRQILLILTGFSIALIVCLDTPTAFARSSWERSSPARAAFSRKFFMITPPLVYLQEA